LPRGCVEKFLEVAKYNILLIRISRQQKKPLLIFSATGAMWRKQVFTLLGCLEDVENCLSASSVATQAKVDKNDTTPQLPRGCRKVPPSSVAGRKYYFLGCHEKEEKSSPHHFMLD
jgi:hypothetical protein